MAYLKYDTEIMESTKEAYKGCVTDMENLKSDMENMVSEVKTGWKSDASDAFFKKYNDEWLKGFTQYIDVLGHMANNLDIAIENYGEITKQAEALSLETT